MSVPEILQQLAPSPQMLVLLIGVIALLESLALVGLLLPGVVLMTAVASLAGHQDVAVAVLLLVAFVGAVLGDGVSFILGYTQRERVTRLWPLSHYPEWLTRGARFFQRYGSLSIFFGRFVGPVRPIIPLIAGMLRMSPRTFLWANLSSAALWAPAYVLPGYLLGQTWQQLLDIPAGLEALLITLGVVILVLVITFSWLRHQVSRYGRIYRLFASLARQHPLLRRTWLKLSWRQGEVPLASWLLLTLSLGGLSGLTIAVIQAAGPFAFDLEIHAFIDAQVAPLLDNTRALLIRAGDMHSMLILALPWVVWLLYRRHLAVVAHLAAGLGGITLLNALGQALIARPSPASEPLATALSYPSAHTSTAVVLCGLAAAFVAQEIPPARRFWTYWLAIGLALPLTLSHLVAGVHWLSDLLGGALLGLVVCALVRLAWQRHRYAPLTPCPWPWLAVASLALYSVWITPLPAG